MENQSRKEQELTPFRKVTGITVDWQLRTQKLLFFFLDPSEDLFTRETVSQDEILYPLGFGTRTQKGAATPTTIYVFGEFLTVALLWDNAESIGRPAWIELSAQS